jgi:urea transport system permease protein
MLRTVTASALVALAASFLLQPSSPTAATPPPPAPAAPAATAAGVDAAKVTALLVKLATADAADRKAVLQDLAKTGDQRLEAAFADFGEGSLYLWKEQVVTCKKLVDVDGIKAAPLVDPLTRQPLMADGKPVVVPADQLKEVSASRRDRVAIRDAVNLLRLSDVNREARLAAIVKAGENAVDSSLPALEEMANTEADAAVRRAVREAIALIKLGGTADDAAAQAARMDAARALGDMRSLRALPKLTELRKAEHGRERQRTLDAAIARINQWQTTVEWTGYVFSGLSASSILILMALGLAIIFGLMGVINMAHGELMMIGAYATYLTQQGFVRFLPEGAFDWYFVAAIPAAFLAAAVAGMVLEATVIRFLYGRPLETLLATFGVGYVLVQLVRVQFGDNIAVNSPTWLRGSWEVVGDIRLPYNRLFIIGFCVACIGLMYFIIEKTKLGLLLRATTQNRTMAASLGVSTRRIDMLTFGLGAGLAGLAGCALTQIGGVTPDMGSNYIIDSFLVVVTGGVGKLAGAIWAGLGLGMTNKFMEPVVGTVWAKVLILVLVVLFIQRRPSGLFPAKGRLADV